MRSATKRKLIYIRYLFPPAIMLIIPLLMLIPSYTYVVGGDPKESISAWSFLGDSFSTSRQILFGTGEYSAADSSFALIMFILVIVSLILYLVAFAVALYSAIVSMRYFLGENEEKAERSRTLFITFFPNRVVLTAVELLILPLMILPYLMPYLFYREYRINVTLVFSAPDALMLIGVFLLGIILLSAICARMERAFDVDLFKKRESFSDDGEEDKDDNENLHSADVNERGKEELNRRIRELLQNKKDD